MKVLEEMRLKIRKLFRSTRILTVVGAYWGDEGKGKIIDAIAPLFDIIARYSGGANAGHTVFTENGIKVVSHLIPCGIAQNKPCVMGPGVFFDIEAFLVELQDAQKVVGDSLPRIIIDPNCPVRTPYHSLFEGWLEFCRGKNAINTTNKAIGPLAGFDALRNGIRVADLFLPPEVLADKLFELFTSVEPVFSRMHASRPLLEIPHPDFVVTLLSNQAQKINRFIADVPAFLRQEFKNGAKILAEGAQSVGLDRTYGTYPYVSSGLSTNLGAPQGLGIAPKYFDTTLLVAKALPTRVGAGEFPSEIWSRSPAEKFPHERQDLFGPESNGSRSVFLKGLLEKINNETALNSEISQYYQVLGDERGATTGRGRSVGYADWEWLRYAAQTTGADMLALTRFDMLNGIKSIPYVSEYDRNGDAYTSLGGNPTRGNIAPFYERLDGWDECIDGITDWDDLPSTAQNYVNRLEVNLGNVPINFIGTSPSRAGLIVRDRF